MGLLWVGVWMFPLLDPISTIHTGQGGVVAGVGLGLFMLTYVVTTTLGFDHRADLSGILTAGFGVVAALGVVLAAAYGEHWFVVMLFVATCGMAAYAGRERVTIALCVLASVVATTVLLGLLHDAIESALVTVVGLVLASGLVGAVRQMQRLIRELRADPGGARRRPRSPRSGCASPVTCTTCSATRLSLIVVKAEVAAPHRPNATRPRPPREAADIEDIGRRALVEVREAVTGYRRARPAAELDRRPGGAVRRRHRRRRCRTAGTPLPATVDGVLGWVVREADDQRDPAQRRRRCDIEVSHRGRRGGLECRDDGAPAPVGAGRAHGLRGPGRTGCAALGGTLRGRGRPARRRVPAGRQLPPRRARP